MKFFLVFFFLITVFFAGCVFNRSQNASVQNSSAEVSADLENKNIQTPELSFEELQELVPNQNTNATETETPDAQATNTNDGDQNEQNQTESNLNVSQTAQNNPEARARDEQRIKDVQSLQAALQAHFEAEGFYPETFDRLVPSFLKELPKNPTPGGHEFIYTPIGSLPAQFYDLSYELEVGTDEVSAGPHVATPKGLAQP